MSKKYFGNPEVVKEYKRELTRLKRLTSSMKKRGYILPENSIPQTPKKITQASVKRLKKITPSSLYEKSKMFSPDDGNFISGKVARGIERRRAGEKGAITRYYNQLMEKELEKAEDDLRFYDLNASQDDFETPQWLKDEIDTYINIPTIDNADENRELNVEPIDKVREDLSEIPSFPLDKYRTVVDMRDMWLYINEMFEDKIASYNGKYSEELLDYLNSIISSLEKIKDDLNRPSKTREDIEQSYAELLRVISGIPFSREQAEMSGEISDYFSNWNPIE